MANVDDDEEEEQEQQVDAVENLSVGSVDKTHKDEQPQETSLIQSFLRNEIEERDDKKKKKKKKKVKTIREKELERLTKATKTIFITPAELNNVCERIHSLLSGHKTMVLAICRSLDKLNTGHLSSEQFRVVIRDRIPQMSAEDIFVLTKLFDVEGLVDYRMILDEKLGNGILRHVTTLSIPQPNEIILEKKPPKGIRSSLFNESVVRFNQTKYVNVHLRFAPFDSYNAYPGHIRLKVHDHISIYALSKMIIDERDFATPSMSIFREKVPSRATLLDPMRTLEFYHYTGAYVDGTHNQSFPTYTLYYDYSPMGRSTDCPILKCDYYYI